MLKKYLGNLLLALEHQPGSNKASHLKQWGWLDNFKNCSKIPESFSDSENMRGKFLERRQSRKMNLLFSCILSLPAFDPRNGASRLRSWAQLWLSQNDPDNVLGSWIGSLKRCKGKTNQSASVLVTFQLPWSKYVTEQLKGWRAYFGSRFQRVSFPHNAEGTATEWFCRWQWSTRQPFSLW